MKTLRIGDWVSVKATTEMVYDDKSERKPFRTEVVPFVGQVVGMKNRQTGHYKSGGRGWEGDYDPPYLSATGVVRLWLVRAGMMNKEIEVADDDLEPTQAPESGLPVRALRAKGVVQA